MRRKQGVLIPIEVAILQAMLGLLDQGTAAAHGFLIAKEMRDRVGAKKLAAYGTLYKALDRLESQGLLKSSWEDPQVAANESRPRRRYYVVTPAGEIALAKHYSAISQATVEPAGGTA